MPEAHKTLFAKPSKQSRHGRQSVRRRSAMGALGDELLRVLRRFLWF